MTRLACLLGLLALAMIFPLATRLSGSTAIWFVFVGMPALALATLLYGVVAWRAGGFHFRRVHPAAPAPQERKEPR